MNQQWTYQKATGDSVWNVANVLLRIAAEQASPWSKFLLYPQAPRT